MRLFFLIVVLMFSIAGCLFDPSQGDRTLLTEYGNITFDFTETKYERAMESGKPTVLDFSAEWCPACYEAIPVVEGLKEEYGDRVNIMTVNYDDHTDFARGFGVVSLPSFVFFDKNGEPVKVIVGSQNEKKIKDLIDELL